MIIINLISKKRKRLYLGDKLYIWNYKLTTKLGSEKIILGIDPGTTIMGFGLIKVVDKKMELIVLDELMLKKYDDHYLKLKLIFERTIHLIDEIGRAHV